MADENIVVAEETTPAEKTYTQKEVDSLISKAINEAVAKNKPKVAKTFEDQIADLQKQVRAYETKEYISSKLSEAGLDQSLSSYVSAETNEEIDAKIESLGTYLKGFGEKAIQDKIKDIKPINMVQSTAPDTKHLSLAERQARYDNGGH